MLYSTIKFRCDHFLCNTEAQFVSIDYARKGGWAISRDRFHCYCPKCAPFYRNVGRSDLGRRKYINGFGIGDKRE